MSYVKSCSIVKIIIKLSIKSTTISYNHKNSHFYDLSMDFFQQRAYCFET